MQITILGSTGFLGKVLVEKALERGYEIKTLVRDPEKLGHLKQRVQYLKGNMFNSPDVEAAVEGSEIVISTIAPNKRIPEQPDKYHEAMKGLVSTLEQKNVQKFIHVGGAAHLGGMNEKWDFKRRFLRFILLLLSKKILITKELEWKEIKQSSLNWILVRPSGIVTKPSKGRVLASETYLAGLSININDLADFILQQIHSDSWDKKAPLISNE
ncbi:MAG TPA: NAD(P)H-binding protein [Bacteroidales bacterium]|nr:NAD(P)H-binding protein [Bacteroidales bacterium]